MILSDSMSLVVCSNHLFLDAMRAHLLILPYILRSMFPLSIKPPSLELRARPLHRVYLLTLLYLELLDLVLEHLLQNLFILA